MDKQKWTKGYHLILLGAVCALAIFACLFLYQHDNKYTAPSGKGANGVLLLDEQTLEEHPVVFLVEGWEYYSGRLLQPEDFNSDPPTPDAYIFIGQYGGFDAGDRSAPPHGSASYRLRVQLPEEPGMYLLELPEIFSAYRAYVNGTLVQTMGEPDPAGYFPETGNRTVKIEAAGQIDILLAVSDFSHFYSGLVYPPAFGEPSAVSALLSSRIVFRSIFLALAFAVGGIALLIGISGGKKRLAVLFSLLCLFFIGYTSYPIIRTLTSAYYPFYVVETISFCAMLSVVVLLQRALYGNGRKLDWILIGFGGLMSLGSALLPPLLTSGKLWVMGGYSYFITAYQWIAAAYLTVKAVRAVVQGISSKTLLAGILMFDVALIMDRLLPFYEPAVTGWFPELASFALILCIGITIAKEVAEKYKESAILQERMSGMQRLWEMQCTNFERLREQIEETKTAQHDLRHHFVMIERFLQNQEYENLKTYMKKYQQSICRVQPIVYSKNTVVNVLVGHYAEICEKENIRLTLKLEIEQEIKVSETDLCGLLSNLLENSLEACRRQKEGERFITLSIGKKPSMITIRVENSTDGNVTKHGEDFLSSKEKNRKGYGLNSIRSISKRYGGEVEFTFDNTIRIFVSTVLLMFE